MTVIALLTIHLQLPGVTSLKEKRSRIRPILARLHREFNVSAAEVDHLDAWQETVLACSLVSNDRAYAQQARVFWGVFLYISLRLRRNEIYKKNTPKRHLAE